MARHQIIPGGRVLDPKTRRADPADILIRGDEIAEIGPPGLAAPADAAVVDAKGFLLHAGLVNAHTHGHSNLAKAAGDKWTLELLLAAGPWITGTRQVEEKYLSTLIGACEMLLKGCTSVYDLMIEIPVPSVDGIHAAARAYRDAGMRAVIAPTAADISFYVGVPGLLDAFPEPLRRQVETLRASPAEASLGPIRDILKSWPFDRERVRPAVAPAIPIFCTDSFVTACRDLAKEFGCGLHTHLLESKVQAVVGRDRYGTTITGHLEKLGVLGPHFTGAHGVWVDEEDMKRLAGAGANIAHNPASNMRLGNGIARVVRMRELGVTVGIGTDSVTCSDNLNMYESMRLAAMSSRVQSPDTDRWLAAEDCFRAATEASARALGFEKIGRLAPGHKADIVFLDLAAINWIPLVDAMNQVVNVEDGTSVDSVMVGGAFAVRHRKLVNVDLADLKRRADAAWQEMAARHGDRRALFDSILPIVDSFCPAVAHRPYHVERYAAPVEN
jgi:5-methylthioadenosine/S-adenosylhomocysteine deaminase